MQPEPLAVKTYALGLEGFKAKVIELMNIKPMITKTVVTSRRRLRPLFDAGRIVSNKLT